jgi:hypothetical protein
MSVPGGASTKSGLGGLFTEDCHCCNQSVLILQFALVEIVAEHPRHPQGPIAWRRKAGKQQGGLGQLQKVVGGQYGCDYAQLCVV